MAGTGLPKGTAGSTVFDETNRPRDRSLDQNRSLTDFIPPTSQKSNMEQTVPRGTGLNLQSWSDAEQTRKTRMKENWLKELEDNKELRIQRKQKEDEENRIADLKLEMKIKQDLEELKDEFDKEMGKSRINADATSQVQYQPMKERSMSPARSERKKTPDTYSMYKRGDGFDDDVSQFQVPMTSHAQLGLKQTMRELEEERRRLEAHNKSQLDSLTALQHSLEDRQNEQRQKNQDFYKSLTIESMKQLTTARRRLGGYDSEGGHSLGMSLKEKALKEKLTPYQSRFGSTLAHQRYSNYPMKHESVFIGANDKLVVQPSAQTYEALDKLMTEVGPQPGGELPKPMS